MGSQCWRCDWHSGSNQKPKRHSSSVTFCHRSPLKAIASKLCSSLSRSKLIYASKLDCLEQIPGLFLNLFRSAMHQFVLARMRFYARPPTNGQVIFTGRKLCPGGATGKVRITRTQESYDRQSVCLRSSLRKFVGMFANPTRPGSIQGVGTPPIKVPGEGELSTKSPTSFISRTVGNGSMVQRTEAAGGMRKNR